MKLPTCLLQPVLRHIGLMAALLLASVGCAVTPPKVDPYSTLLPPGRAISDRAGGVSTAGLKQSTAFLVVGANFVAYSETWSKFQKSAEAGGNLVYSRAFLLDLQAQWSPARITSLVVESLRRRFKDVVVVDDLADARDKGATWIVMFDHAFVQTSTATATWANATTIDLLDKDLRRVLAATFTESKDYGAAWSEADVQRFAQHRGNDIVRSVNGAIAQFDTKLAAQR